MRRPHLLALLTLAPACAIDASDDTTPAALYVVKDEQMLCDQKACFLHKAADRDRDGIADLDEEKLGTDPDRFLSRPELPEVFRTLPDLPTFREGSSMMLLLPTFTPFGQEVFGGEALLPAKHSLLDQMGIKLPEDGSIDLTDGFTLTRSLSDPAGISFHTPPWLMPTPPAADTTADAGGSGTIGEAMKGHGPKSDFKIESASTSDGYNFAQFSYRDSYGNAWSVSSQTSTEYSHVVAETHESSSTSGWSFDQTVEVTRTEDEHGTETTKVTTTHETDEDGKTTTSKTVTETTATSDDGRVEYHSKQTDDDVSGTSTSESEAWIDGEHVTGEGAGAPAGETTEEGDSTAHYDPDYMEYVPSPEAMDAAMTLHQGPVQTVNPLDADEQTLQFSVTGAGGGSAGNSGPVSLYTPDAYETTLSEPVIVHMPFGGDHSQDPPDEAPAPDGTTVGGQCIYCNQGGDE